MQVGNLSPHGTRSSFEAERLSLSNSICDFSFWFLSLMILFSRFIFASLCSFSSSKEIDSHLFIANERDPPQFLQDLLPTSGSVANAYENPELEELRQMLNLNYEVGNKGGDNWQYN